VIWTVLRFVMWAGAVSTGVAAFGVAWILGLDALRISIPVAAAFGLALPGLALVAVARRLLARPKLEAVIEIHPTRASVGTQTARP
jgi:hypothetical protein